MLVYQKVSQDEIEFQEYLRKQSQEGPKYIVVQKVYDSGKVEAYVEERQDIPDWMIFKKAIRRINHRLYYHQFTTMDAAEKFKDDCLNQ